MGGGRRRRRGNPGNDRQSVIIIIGKMALFLSPIREKPANDGLLTNVSLKSVNHFGHPVFGYSTT